MFILLHLFNSFSITSIRAEGRIGPHDQIGLAQIKRFRAFKNGIASSFIMGNAISNAVDMRDETVFARTKM